MIVKGIFQLPIIGKVFKIQLKIKQAMGLSITKTDVRTHTLIIHSILCQKMTATFTHVFLRMI